MKKKAAKKVTHKVGAAAEKLLKKLTPKPVTEPTREELREILQKEKPGSAKGFDAALKMLGHIEKDTVAAKGKKVQYFPPIKREEVIKPETHKVMNDASKKMVENAEKFTQDPASFKRVQKDQQKKRFEKAMEIAKETEIPQVTLAEICKKLKLEPSEVRKALRASKTPKPGAQWSWPASETPRLWKLVEKVHKDWMKSQK